MEDTLINSDVLLKYGFKINEKKSKDRLTIFYKDKFEVVLVDDGSLFYSNLGFEYPLKDVAALKKLYKEVRREELLPAP
ncbi:MAG: hypothetical protein H0W73_08065 [Bacteroidetes bacterium]|nr:hypothetical protein [Bacteroidota bacterium]